MNSRLLKHLFLLLFLLSFSQHESFAQTKCDSLFLTDTGILSSQWGASFLQNKYSTLHTSAAVERASKKQKSMTGKSSIKPVDKLNNWLISLERIAKKAESSSYALSHIKSIMHKEFVIKRDEIPQSYYDLQVLMARELGHGDITLTSEYKKKLAEIAIKDQKHSLDLWTEFLVSKDTAIYPMWLKYWMYTGMAKLSKYDPQMGKFKNRDKNTVAPFIEINREAIGLTADYVLKFLNKKSLDDIQDPELISMLPGLNFGKLYGHTLLKLNVGKEGSFVTNQGQWVTYKQGSDHIPLVKSLEGQNTGWCTAGEATAKRQLQGGDFHVYYSLDSHGQPTIPRVAIRMENGKIGEMRGVGNSQNLDFQINQSTVVTSKLKEFGEEGSLYLKRDHDMRLLNQIEAKHKLNNPLSKEESRFLWEIDNKIDGFGNDKDPRIAIIRSNRDVKSDLVAAFDGKYTREEVSTTREEFNLGKSKIHFGDLSFRSLKTAQGLELPDILIGNLYFYSLQSAKGLNLPMTINGRIYFDNLRSAEGLKLPVTMNGGLYFYSLQSAKGLNLPTTMNGDIYLNSLRSAEGLKLPVTMNGGLYFYSLQSAKGLNLPTTMNGDLHFDSLRSAEGLNLPTTMNGNLYLTGLQSAEGLNLPTRMNGGLSLPRLASAEGLNLPMTMNGGLYLTRLQSAEGLKLPTTLNGNLYLTGLQSLVGLKLPTTFNGKLYTNGLN